MSADYTNRPIGELLRGPLLTTPQGKVVVVSAFAYLSVALLLAAGIVDPPLHRNLGVTIIGCVFMPFLIFLFFVKEGQPSFEPSRMSALFLAICAVIPVVIAARA